MCIRDSTNRTASLSPKVEDLSYRNVTFDQLYDAYYEQVDGLVQGGIDIVMTEPIFDTLNCTAAIIAVKAPTRRSITTGIKYTKLGKV